MTENQAPYGAPPRPLDVDGLASRNGVGWKTEAARYIQALERSLEAKDPMDESYALKILALESTVQDLEASLAKLDGMTAEEGAMILWVARYGERHQKPAIAMSFSTQDYRAMAAALLAALRTP